MKLIEVIKTYEIPWTEIEEHPSIDGCINELLASIPDWSIVKRSFDYDNYTLRIQVRRRF